MSLSSPVNSRLGPKVAQSVLASIMVLASACALAALAPLLRPQQQPTDAPGESRWAPIRRAATVAFVYARGGDPQDVKGWESLPHADEEQAKQELARLRFVGAPSEADLILLFVKDEISGSCYYDEDSKKSDCSDDETDWSVLVIKGGPPPARYRKQEILWETSWSQSQSRQRGWLGTLGRILDKIGEKGSEWAPGVHGFKAFVEKLEVLGGRSADVKQRIKQGGVGARVKGKFADGEKFKGSVEAVEEDTFLLTPRKKRSSGRVFYEEVDELEFTDLKYQASGQPDPAEAKRVIGALGVGKYLEVKLADKKKLRGRVQAIEGDQLVLLPEGSDTATRIPYRDIVRVK